MKHSKFEFLGLALVACSGVWAQNLPDAGSLMRQNEQMFKQGQMQRQLQRLESLPPALAMTEATSVTPQRIKFLGAKLLTDAQLQAVAQPYLNRALTQHDLNHLTDAVVQAYRQVGWLVRAYIPQQDLSQAELNVQILENIPPSAR